MEFLLRNTTVPDPLIQKTLTLLPLSGADSRLKKTLLLRVLQTHTLNASISEASLQILEHLEEIYRDDGVSISNVFQSAYCAVAVECTVKYLINSPEDPSGEYFSAVRRIWRGRRGSGLVSDGFVQWGEEIEGALWDVRVAERLVGLNTRRDAVIEVKRFLKEAWGSMGDSFLDLIALVSKGNGLCPGGVCENAAEGSRRLLEGLGKEKANDDDVAMGENHGNRQLEENGLGGGMSRRRNGRLEGLGKEKMNDDENDNVNDIVDDSDDNDDETMMGENHGNEESEERVGTSVDANQEVEQRAGTSRMGDKGVCEIAEEGEDLRKRDGRLEGLGKEKMNDDGDDVNDNVDGVELMDGNRGNEQLEARVRTSGMRDKEIRKDNGQLKRKHSALQTRHRGVKLSGDEEARPINFSTKYENLRSADVKKLQESLKSSSLELKALVKDPLPDALHTSEAVRSKLATKDINRRPASEKQSEHVDVRDSDACKTIVPYQPNDANFAKEPSVPCSSDRPNCSNGSRPNYSNDRRPNLMRRASYAQTYEWDDSIENLPQQSQPRRKKRKWTSLEEETLRAGVRMFGEGNWRTILDFYSTIFEYRNGVDLKDKWRNMMR